MKKEKLLVKACQKYQKDATMIATTGTIFFAIGKSEPSERMKTKIKAELKKS